MSVYRNSFPEVNATLLLAYVGMETDLIYNRGMDLPGFASFPLLDDSHGRSLLCDYMSDLIALGRDVGAGVILESPTWVANRDRAGHLGYGPDDLKRFNQDAIAMMAALRGVTNEIPIVLSANIGPRYDAYSACQHMESEEAEKYHAEQIEFLSETGVDVISAYTSAYPAEAIGIVCAARRYGLPVVISFTLETDGKLPSGVTLEEAISHVDAATNSYAAYFMVNCAHPDHIAPALSNAPWMERLRGIVANASRCSHAELDVAEELDDGDPVELGQELAALRNKHPNILVLGGCCGTDMRHMGQIVKAVVSKST